MKRNNLEYLASPQFQTFYPVWMIIGQESVKDILDSKVSSVSSCKMASVSPPGLALFAV